MRQWQPIGADGIWWRLYDGTRFVGWALKRISGEYHAGVPTGAFTGSFGSLTEAAKQVEALP